MRVYGMSVWLCLQGGHNTFQRFPVDNSGTNLNFTLRKHWLLMLSYKIKWATTSMSMSHRDALHCTAPHCTAPHRTAIHHGRMHSVSYHTIADGFWCRTALPRAAPSWDGFEVAPHCTAPFNNLLSAFERARFLKDSMTHGKAFVPIWKNDDSSTPFIGKCGKTKTALHIYGKTLKNMTVLHFYRTIWEKTWKLYTIIVNYGKTMTVLYVYEKILKNDDSTTLVW